jgi:uncharacterized UPF0146 family protein
MNHQICSSKYNNKPEKVNKYKGAELVDKQRPPQELLKYILDTAATEG